METSKASLQYVTDGSGHGGWNKQHIWAVTHNPEYSDYWGSATPLCGGLNPKSINYSWYMGNKTPLDMATDSIPLEKFDHKCDKCQRKWFSLRMQEGHTPQGVFGV